MTVPEQAVALLPCPFCGTEPFVYRGMTDGNLGKALIYCTAEDCFGPRTTAANLEDATAQWNKRAALPLVGVQREDVAWAILPVIAGLNLTNIERARVAANDAAAAVLALPAQAWQPIETAPKEPMDGYAYGPTLLLVVDGQLGVGFWDYDFKKFYVEYPECGSQPTRWMLPPIIAERQPEAK